MQAVTLSDDMSANDTPCNYAEHVSLFLTQCNPKNTHLRARRRGAWDAGLGRRGRRAEIRHMCSRCMIEQSNVMILVIL